MAIADRFRLRLACTISLLAVVAIVCGFGSRQTVGFVREIPWHGTGAWLKLDTHIHTRFSDGARTVQEIASKSSEFGCDAIVITDHADRNLKAATPAYFEAIAAARRAYPAMIILTGLEWNIPPSNGDEHLTVIVDPAVEHRLIEFKERFDDLERPSHDAALAVEALRWLHANATVRGVPPVLIYEHPSRRDEHTMSNAADVRAWRRVNDLVIGFAGAPGHQGDRPTGSYRFAQRTIDRWDPAIARIGDAWDTLLGEGLDIWAALAPSDFHSDSPDLNDFWPGQFSETWAYVPERTPAGVLRALRAGSFFASHGRVVREVEFNVTAPGLTRAATAGETIVVPDGSRIGVELRFQLPDSTWADGAARIDQVELIGIDATGARIISSNRNAEIQARPMVIRARGYQNRTDGTRLAFYTNPIRVRTSR